MLWIHAAGASCTLAYGVLAWSAQQPGGPPLALFFGSLAGAALATFALFWRLGKRGAELPVACLIGWAIVFRVCGLLGGPVYEDDYFRYLWDGFRFATTGSPYGAAPEESFADPSIPEAFQRVLDGINNPDLPTIYGPTTQAAFLVGYWLRPASIGILQLILVIADLAIVALLLRLAPPRNVLLYAWCPLVVKEVAFTAHPDGVGVALLLAAIVLARERRWWAAAVSLGLACGAKVFAVLLAPFVLARARARYWATCGATLGVLYAPFVLAGGTDLESLVVFATEWEFNSAVYGPLATAIGSLGARVVLGAACCAAALRYYRICRRVEATAPPRGDLFYGALLAASPVINAWYLLWLLPFATIVPSLWAWTASVAVLLSYVTGLNLGDASFQPYEQPAWVRPAEFGTILAAVSCDVWRRTARRATVPCSTD